MSKMIQSGTPKLIHQTTSMLIQLRTKISTEKTSSGRAGVEELNKLTHRQDQFRGLSWSSADQIIAEQLKQLIAVQKRTKQLRDEQRRKKQLRAV
ncbi:hypothetical protein F511_27151 [Dorcoceras hygrometricum]|uniref:Uncharacterized protein n=1 Tax=Dorcoceras hygrometricum TaxID=472368 RepID=A0A2Z7ABL1_9LAMI|nr:hypothetical protein F511_27151 [Dorcoceras hygrometricum]